MLPASFVGIEDTSCKQFFNGFEFVLYIIYVFAILLFAVQKTEIKPLISEELTANSDVVKSSASKNYMSSTHRVSEAVSQPSLLKGGDLKEYQLSGLQWLVSLYNNNLNGNY